MPLRRGSSSATISANIAQLYREGYPMAQAQAIAYRKAGRSRRRNPTGLGVRPWLWLALGAALLAWAASRTKEGGNVIAKAIDTAAGAFGGPRGIRNNNPGNIKRTGDQWQGMAADQPDPVFVTFIAPEWGFRAMTRILRGYAAAGAHTVRAIINRWAPPSENITSAYVDDVAKRLGVGPDDPIDLDAVLPGLLQAIALHENGAAALDAFGPEVYAQGIALEASA